MLFIGASVALTLTACGISNSSTIVSSGNTLQVRSDAQKRSNSEAFVLPATQKDATFVLEEKTAVPMTEKVVVQETSTTQMQTQAQAAETHSCGR
ncbi:MAG: hypothetical protein KIH69_021660 [Anaerolineae bacterium]|nr:hypothetical protein [Anaerolineae bacterium]